MKTKRFLAAAVAMVLLFGLISSVYAATTEIAIPRLNYFVMHALNKNDTVVFSYKNTSATTQTVVARITDPNGGTSGIAGKLQGDYSVVYPNNSSMALGTISGSNLAGGCSFLAPGASFKVKLNVTAPNETVGFSIKFDAQ